MHVLSLDLPHGVGVARACVSACEPVCGFNGKVILKGDQEAAIEDLMREVAKHRGDLETVLEFSPVRDSSGNGAAEKGVQTIEGLVHTHLLELDERLQCELLWTWHFLPFSRSHGALP